MAKEKSGTTMVAPHPRDEKYPVEGWADRKGTPKWQLAGAMRMQGWAAGKAAGEAEYDAAIKAFLRKPLGGASK